MHIKLDWLSFSLVWHSRTQHGAGDTLSNINIELDQLDPDLMNILDIGAHWENSPGRKTYTDSFTHPVSKIRLFFNPLLKHCLFEISGQGCDWLYQRGDLLRLLSIVHTRLTRIDIACDMEVATSPEEFVNQREMKRFKASSHVKEESGETRYVGSRKSNRFTRVYRYNDPHPRSHLLRCEYELHSEDAKHTGLAVLKDGLESVAVKLGEDFGWKHPDWERTLAQPAELTAYRAERGQGKTLFWLANTVAPLLQKLHRDGVLDVQEFFETYVYCNLYETEYDKPGFKYAEVDGDEIPF